MKEIGIVRRIGDEGRITIPKEVRRIMNMPEGSIVGMYTDGENIILRKYEPEACLNGILEKFNSKLDFEETDMDYNKVKEIRKNIENIKKILDENR